MMNPKFKDRSISIYYNDIKICEFKESFTYKQIHEVIKKILKEDIPIMVIIYGMPGSGKTFLSHLLSEQLLHCMILELDTIYAIGNRCSANKEVAQDKSLAIGFFSYIFDMLTRTFRCNIICPLNIGKYATRMKDIDGYDKVVIAFDKISIEESSKHGIHGLNYEETEDIYGDWMSYDELIKQGEVK